MEQASGLGVSWVHVRLDRRPEYSLPALPPRVEGVSGVASPHVRRNYAPAE